MKKEDKEVIEIMNKIVQRAWDYYDSTWMPYSDMLGIALDDKFTKKAESLVFNCYLYNSFKVKNPILRYLKEDKRYKKKTISIINAMIKSKLKIYSIVNIDKEIIVLKDILNDVEIEVYDKRLIEDLEGLEVNNYYVAAHLVFFQGIFVSVDSVLLYTKSEGFDDFISLYQSVPIPEFLLSIAVILFILNRFEKRKLANA